jgi:hypothetical protein
MSWRRDRTANGGARVAAVGPRRRRGPCRFGTATTATVAALVCLLLPTSAGASGRSTVVPVPPLPTTGAPPADTTPTIPPVGEAAGSPSDYPAARAHATGPPSSLHFAGYTWQVKSSTSPIGPGPNIFDAKGPRVDASGAMRLRIVKVGSTWESSEVVLDPTLGYGTYVWRVHGPVASLDPNVVLALFTYDTSDTSPSNREIDFEASRFGTASQPTNAQYVVQPYETPGNLQRITIPSGETTTVSMTWVPGRVTFSGFTVKGKKAYPLPSWTNTSTSVPTSATEQVHMSLWLFRGAAPSNGKPVSVNVTSFTFTPAG